VDSPLMFILCDYTVIIRRFPGRCAGGVSTYRHRNYPRKTDS
jgi:hypothetical protein